MYTILIISGLVTYAGVVSVMAWRYAEINRGKGFSSEPSLSSVVSPKIDRLAYYISIAVFVAFRNIKVLLILAVAKLLLIFKKVIIRLEKRFSGVVNQLKGKGEINQRGSVSLFLVQVKEHRDKVRAESVKAFQE